MNRKIKNVLKSSFDIPEPTRKEKFLNNLPYPKVTSYQFFISQIGYIRKRFWCLSILLFVGMAVFCTQINQGKETIGLISSILPLFTLLTITEISKSMSFNMSEMEASCRFNLSKITLIRLSIIGVFHFLIILLTLFVFKDNSQFGLVRYALYVVTPFLLSSYLSFWITNHFKTNETIFICSGVTIFISLSILLLNLNHTVIFEENYEALWGITFMVSIILLIKEIHYLLKERIGQWNFV